MLGKASYVQSSRKHQHTHHIIGFKYTYITYKRATQHPTHTPHHTRFKYTYITYKRTTQHPTHTPHHTRFKYKYITHKRATQHPTHELFLTQLFCATRFASLSQCQCRAPHPHYNKLVGTVKLST